jgi:hypothetical protein
MTIKFADWAGETTPTLGIGDITLGGSVANFSTFESLGDCEVFYTIIDGVNKETGIGAITGRVLERMIVTGVMIGDQVVPNASPINLSGTAQVYGTINAKYFEEIQNTLNSIQTGYQPLDDTLTAFSGLIGTANTLAYFNGTDAMALTPLTAFMRTLLDDADAAAGRATLGALSSGTLLPDNTDLNAVVVTGFYRAGLAINPPILNGNYGQLIVSAIGDTILQIYSLPFSNFLYQRTKTPSGWLPWMQIYSQNNILGTVSQSAGVPTGAIIEKGSNANGEYSKLADGSVFMTNNITTSASGPSVWVYPITIMGLAGISALPDENIPITVTSTGAVQSQVSLNTFNSAGARYSLFLRCFVKARWF